MLKLLDESVQFVTVHHPGDIVGRRIDAVVSHARLREVVSADFFGTFAGADLRTAGSVEFALALFVLDLVEPCFEDAHGAQAVLELRAFVLARHDDAGGFVVDAIYITDRPQGR